MALTPEEINLLPPEIRAATLEKIRLEAEAHRASIERNNKNCFIGAAMSAGGACFIDSLSSPSWPMYVLIALVAAAGGFWTVLQRYKIFGGVLAVGASCIAANVLGIILGLVPLGSDVGSLMLMLSSWLFYMGLGAFIGHWADGERFRHSSGF